LFERACAFQDSCAMLFSPCNSFPVHFQDLYRFISSTRIPSLQVEASGTDDMSSCLGSSGSCSRVNEY
jgi:hypothetical protein